MAKVLIADDESNILMLLEILLKDLGLEVMAVDNGEKAIKKAVEYQPDLIITDIVMPKKNGFEVCRFIRENQELKHIPVILLSALGDEYNKITGFEEGADDYVIKPFNIEELKARTKALLLRHHARKKEIEISPAVRQKVNQEIYQGPTIDSGISQLNDCLYGGFPVGSNLLILGTLGKGKSSFARQFIAQGLLQEEPCLFISIDDNPKKIREKLNHLTKDRLKTYEDKNAFRLIDAYSWSSMSQPEEPYAVSGTLELSQLSGVISDASQDLGQTVQLKKGGRRVVDSISSLLIHFELPAVQRFLNQISRTALALGGITTLFIIEEGTIPEQTLNNIKYAMDGIILFDEQDGKRSVQVSSMKWSPYVKKWVTF